MSDQSCSFHWNPPHNFSSSRIFCLLVLLAPLLLNPSSQAATINYVGTEPGTAASGYATANWSNPGVAKLYDLGGVERYGTAGYYDIRPMAWDPGAASIYTGVGAGNDLGISASSNPTLYSKPVMVSSITGGAGDYVNFGGYSIFRGPDGSALYRQGGLSVPVSTGAYGTPGGNGFYGEAFNFTTALATTFRVGVAVDTVASGTYAPNYVGIYNNTTGTVFSTALTRDGTPDMAVFEIDAAAGESFTAAMWQLSGTQSAAAYSLVTFDVSKYNFNVASGSQTNSAVLNGAPAALVKTGEGTLVVTSSNSYGGGTLISAGTLKLQGGSVSGNITNNGNLTLSADLANSVSGTGSLTKTEAGNATLWNPNSYGGATVVEAGQLRLDGSGAISSNSVVQIASGAGFSATGIFKTSNDLTIAGLTGAGQFFNAAGNLTVNKATTNTSDVFTGSIDGGTGLIKSGAGTLELSGSNSYSGVTTVSGGTLNVRHANALGATNGGTVVSNGILRITATNSSGIALIGENVTLAGGSTNQATFISERSGSITPTNTYQGKITLGGAEARIDSLGSSTLVLTNSGNVIESANNATLAIGGAGSVVLNGAVSLGTGGIQKLGSGSIFVQEGGTLGGANSSLLLTSGNIDLGARSLSNSSFTITGGILTNGTLTAATYNLNGGSVRANLGAGSVNANTGTTSVTSEGTLGASIINVAGGTLNLQAAGRLSSGAVANVSSGTLSTGGNETITRLNATGGTVNLDGDILTVTGTGANKSTIASSATLTGGTISVQGALDYQASSGTTALSVASSGTLSGSGTTSGTLSVAGNLAPGNSTGILNVGNTTFLGGGKYTWEIDTFPGGGSGGIVGTNWDFLNIAGTLTISAGTTVGSQFLIDVVSLLASNDASDYAASNFNFTDNYSFAIATASGGISGFTSANQFLINTDGFKNATTAAGYTSGIWSVSVDNTNGSLMLNYTGATAIPEPSTGSLILLGLAAVLRRRKSSR